MARPPRNYDPLRQTETQVRDALNQQLERAQFAEPPRPDYVRASVNELYRHISDGDMHGAGQIMVRLHAQDRQQQLSPLSQLSNKKREAFDQSLNNPASGQNQENAAPSKRETLNQELDSKGRAQPPEKMPEVAQGREELNKAIENSQKPETTHKVDKNLQAQLDAGNAWEANVNRDNRTLER